MPPPEPARGVTRRVWLRRGAAQGLAGFTTGGACAAWPARAAAEDYMSEAAFLALAFGSELPEPSWLYPPAPLRPRIRAVLGHPYKHLRIRYWRRDARTAWVLDEIGKDEEITIGFVVAGDAIERTEVLVFRESRGWEIRFPSFTRQFRGARLDAGDALAPPIDGITGATLSVGAYDRLARLALLLHAQAVAPAPVK